MATISQPSFLATSFAENGTANTIPASNDGTEGLASWSLGFPEITQTPLAQGGLPPQRADFNGIFKAITDFLRYYQSGGVFTYSEDMDYKKNALVVYNDRLYFALQSNGEGTDNGVQAPTNAAYWLPVPMPNKDNKFTTSQTVAGLKATGTVDMSGATSVTAPVATKAKEVLTLEYLSKNYNPVSKVEESDGIVTVTSMDNTKTTFDAGRNVLKRETEYNVGDIAVSPSLPSYLYLECTIAGTTATSEPDFSSVTTGGVTATDGTVTWTTRSINETREATETNAANIATNITNIKALQGAKIVPDYKVLYSNPTNTSGGTLTVNGNHDGYRWMVILWKMKDWASTTGYMEMSANIDLSLFPDGEIIYVKSDHPSGQTVRVTFNTNDTITIYTGGGSYSNITPCVKALYVFNYVLDLS